MRKDWIEYYLDIAESVSKKSKDPSSKVGAVIIDKSNRPVSFGFNGFIKGCKEDKFDWNERRIKYMGVVHAEANAIDFSNQDLTGCILFCTHSPCDDCLKKILNNGIRTVFYRNVSIVKERGTPDQHEAIKRLIESTNADVYSEIGVTYLEDLELE